MLLHSICGSAFWIYIFGSGRTSLKQHFISLLIFLTQILRGLICALIPINSQNLQVALLNVETELHPYSA